MTVIIRKIKNKDGYFGLFRYIGTELKPLLIHNDYDVIVRFCKNEGYTWYFNLADNKAISLYD